MRYAELARSKLYHTYHLAPSVRLCFGSGTASEGIAASNTRDNSGSMLEWQNRTFITGAGKKAEFYPEHLAFQGGNGKASLSDGKAVAFTGMDKLEITAHGTIRLAATNIYGQVPLEINMYRARAYCEAKGKGIAAKGTKSNPPTGTGDEDVGMTLNNTVDAVAKIVVLCSDQIIKYKPFDDDLEETEESFDVGKLYGHFIAGLGVAAAVTGGAIYAASIVFTEGATAVFAPYVIGGLAGLCGGAGVYGMFQNDCQQGEVSSLDSYMATGMVSSLEGVVAGVAVSVTPYAAEMTVAGYAPYGMPLGNRFIGRDKLLDIVMMGESAITASNMMMKINDSMANITGQNPLADTLGWENYEAASTFFQMASNEIIMIGLSNPNLYGRNNYVDEGIKRTRVFKSKDPLVGEVATRIEQEFPNSVKGVNRIIRRPDGSPITDLDIELENIVIQVKSGGAKGFTGQLINTANSINKNVIGYAPDIKPSVLKDTQRHGFDVFTNISDLLEFISRNLGGQ